MSYASAKGKIVSSLKPTNQKPLPELSDEEKEVVADRIRFIKEKMPDCWEFLKDLNENNCIDGMRCVLSVRLLEEVDHGSDD